MTTKARPSLFDIVFVIWAIVVPIGFGYRLLNSDGDLARHLRLGEVMIERRALLREDLFSHTMGGQPFLAFEWGSEVVYAAVYQASGLAGVAIFAGLLIALTYALLARLLIRRGGDPLLAYIVGMVAAVLSAAHWLARPHLFTMLGAVILVGLLTRENRRSLLPYGLLFFVWANLHGGFFFGCVTIALYAFGEIVEAFAGGDKASLLARARHHVAALGVALLASLVNPNGFGLLAHVAGFFGNSAILAQTQEFMSPDFHTVNGKVFLLVLLAVIAALALARRRLPFPVLVLLLANTAFSLVSQRNIELFGIVALPLVALSLDAEWRGLPILRRAKAVFQREHEGRHGGLGSAVVAALLIALALAGGRVAGVQAVPNQFDGRSFPVAAVRQAREAALDGKMFNYFIWGGYLVHEWPEQRIFIDGATDFYGEKLFGEYIQVWNLEPGWRSILKKHGISFAVIPPQSRLADELVRDMGWGIWYCDSTAALLQHPTSGATTARDTAGLRQCGTEPGGARLSAKREERHQ
jgi:hypothetical protein